MQHFIDDFDRQLQIAADVQATHTSSATARKWAGTRKLRLAGGTLATAAAVSATAIVISSAGPTATAEALPILGQPAVNATGRLPAGARGVDPTKARTIKTPVGTAYFVPGTSQACLTIPDPDTAHPELEGGTTCAPLNRIERQGIETALLTKNATYLVAVLPRGAAAPVARTPTGTTETLTARAGTVAATFRTSVDVTFETATGTQRTVPLPMAGQPGGPPLTPSNP